MSHDITYPTPQATAPQTREVSLGILIFSTKKELDDSLVKFAEALSRRDDMTLHINTQSPFEYPVAKTMLDEAIKIWPVAWLGRVQLYEWGQCPPRMPKGAVFFECLQDKVLERFMDK